MAWGIFHPEQFYFSSVEKKKIKPPLDRKVTFYFDGKGFDLTISRRGSRGARGCICNNGII